MEEVEEEDGLTCSALTTSIMTPPFNMRASPALTWKSFCSMEPLTGSSVDIVYGIVFYRIFLSVAKLHNTSVLLWMTNKADGEYIDAKNWVWQVLLTRSESLGRS